MVGILTICIALLIVVTLLLIAFISYVYHTDKACHSCDLGSRDDPYHGYRCIKCKDYNQYKRMSFWKYINKR